MIVLLEIFLLLSVAVAVPISCGGREGEPDQTACRDAKTSGGTLLPNCMNVGESDLLPTWVCAQCSHNCDCPEGEYCPKGPGQFSGTCRSIKSDDRLGRACINFGIPGTEGWVAPILDVNDWAVCGKPVFNSSRVFIRYDWLGSCDRGTCRECSGGLVLWEMDIATAPLVSSCSNWPAQPIQETNRNAYLARDGGSLLCRNSYCKSGTIVGNSRSWMLNAIPDTARVATAAFLGLIFFLLLGWSVIIVLSKCIRIASSRRGKRPNAQSLAADAIASEFHLMGVDDNEDDAEVVSNTRHPTATTRRARGGRQASAPFIATVVAAETGQQTHDVHEASTQ